RHAAGKLNEALLKHALPAVAADDGRIEGDAVERRGDRLARDALRLRVLLERREPGLEAAGVAASRRGIRRPRQRRNRQHRRADRTENPRLIAAAPVQRILPTVR